ncbi:MAG: DUF2147 domain-containing protein [Flavobacteriaceae bacterium]|nr:DUF2147 domain-containing protein [Flavobacteriaceae bacterium]
MKYYYFFFLFFPLQLVAQQKVTGTWETIGDNNHQKESYIQIVEKDGLVQGHILHIIKEADRKKKCIKCKGSDKNKKLIGLWILRNLKKEENQWKGKVLDPKTGRMYSCYIQLEENDKLKVRGYLGAAWIGRTQYWVRKTS